MTSQTLKIEKLYCSSFCVVLLEVKTFWAWQRCYLNHYMISDKSLLSYRLSRVSITFTTWFYVVLKHVTALNAATVSSHSPIRMSLTAILYRLDSCLWLRSMCECMCWSDGVQIIGTTFGCRFAFIRIVSILCTYAFEASKHRPHSAFCSCTKIIIHNETLYVECCFYKIL